MIGGLPEFTNYSAIVAVANINGTGPWSDEAYGLSCDGSKKERGRERK